MNEKQIKGPFMTWRDLVVTPAVWSATLLLPLSVVMPLQRSFSLGLFANVAIYFFSLVLVTLVILKIIRLCRPLNPGTYTQADSPWVMYGWNLHGFLSIVNLGFQQMNALIPPPFRKPFYQCLGMTAGSGIISIGGRIADPYLVTLEAGCIVGDDVLVLGHALTGGSSLKLILGTVHIKTGAVVGARCMVMPGVVIGENAMVKAMSLVTMNTVIGPNEIWAGVPAKKVGEFGPDGEVLK